MNADFRHLTLLLTLTTAASAASAAYVCDAPPTPLDRRACEAAQESAQALRSFIGRMKGMHSLNFHDYVNEARQLAWDERERSVAEATARRVTEANRR